MKRRGTNVARPDNGNGSDVMTHASVVTADHNGVSLMIVKASSRPDRPRFVNTSIASYRQVEYTVLRQVVNIIV